MTRQFSLACLLGISVVATAGTVACGGGQPAAPAHAAAVGPPVIEVTRVIEQPVNVTLSMPGQLDPYEAVAIYPKVTGFIRRIVVDRGSRVRSGDLLIELDAPELTAQRAEAQSKLSAAEAHLAAAQAKADADASTRDRLKAAAATPGVVAGNDLVVAEKTADADQQEVAAARDTAAAARSALDAVTQVADYLRVTAPFDGIVTERNVHPGALVGPNSGPDTLPMVRLVEESRLRLTIPVPEAYIAGVQEGTVMAFSVPPYPGQTFHGTVARIAHAVEIKTRTEAVELDVSNADGRLAPGTFCQIQWPIHRPDPSLWVPTTSVATTTNRTFVVRIRDGRIDWVDVKTGLTSGPLTEVFGQLRADDAVAIRGTDELRAGTAVQPHEAAAPR